MKANKRIRDLRRRNKTGLRRYCPAAMAFVTSSHWTRDEKGRRVPNEAVKTLEIGERIGRIRA